MKRVLFCGAALAFAALSAPAPAQQLTDGVVKLGVSDAEVERLTRGGIVAQRIFQLPWGAVGFDRMHEVMARVRSDDPKPAEKPVFWTDAELALIDRGLDLLNCDRKDLGFQKRPIDDPFRLVVANRCLDDPLSIGLEAQAWDDVAKHGKVDDLLAKVASIFAQVNTTRRV